MAPPNAQSPTSYRFDNVQVLPVERRLQVDGNDVALGARAFDVLLALIERRERLVTRDELLDCVWPDVAVEPNNIAVQVGTLRRVLGPHRIATIPGRGYRFSVALDEQAPALATPPVSSGRRNNLPADLTTPLGRDDDLRRVDDLLETHRLVTVVGAGGIGKTRLAQWLLHRRRDDYQHGVCSIELASTNEASRLPGTIAAALGMDLRGGTTEVALAAVLSPLEILIALDNAEHLLEAISQLSASLLAAAPRLRLIVTSQAPLRLPQEQAYRLGTLTVPPLGSTTAEALAYGAVQLFVLRAQAADPRFVLNDANAAGVIRLCERLDGLPLAIEFAATRVPLLGVDQILESLDQRLQFLKGGYRSAPARQQTMRVTLEWSHHLLGSHERIVFRRLAVIAGSATLELLQATVADDDDMVPDATARLDRWAVLDALSELVDRSLVTLVQSSPDPNRPRYRLLETTRAFAAERLTEAGEVASLEARHARGMATLLEDAWTERWSGRIGFKAWLQVVEEDRDNARTAFAWARQHEAFPLMLAMAPVFLTRALFGGSYGERADVAEVIDRWLQTQPIEAGQLATRVQLTRFWAELELPRSLLESKRALALAEACGDRLSTYLLNACLVRLHCKMGDMDAAADALRCVESLEDPGWPAVRRCFTADARSSYHLFREPQSAKEFLHAQRRMERLAGQDGYVAAGNLIDVELAAGNAMAAASLGWQLIDELADSRNEWALVHVRINLTAALLALDDVERAKAIARVAWRTARHFGVHGECADCLALICAIEQRWSSAAVVVGYADAVYTQRNVKRELNEARAHNRAVERARDALGATEFDRLTRDGAQSDAERIGALVFGDG